MNAEEARQRLYQLQCDLRVLLQEDGDQDVMGLAIPVLDEVLGQAATALPAEDPAVVRLRNVMTPELVANTEQSVRAADLYLVVGQLLAALPHQPIRLRRPSWLHPEGL